MISWALGTYKRINGGLTWHVARMIPAQCGDLPRPGKPICGHGGSWVTAAGPDIRWVKVVSLSNRDLVAVLEAHGGLGQGNTKHCRSCVRKIEEDISVVDRLAEVADE